MNIITTTYSIVHDWLSRHKRMSILLSHGFLHLTILLVLLILGSILAWENFKSSPSDLRYVTIEVGDSLGKTQMKDFHLSVTLSVDSVKKKGKASFFIQYLAQKKNSYVKDSLGTRPYVTISQPSNYITNLNNDFTKLQYGTNNQLLCKMEFVGNSESPILSITNANSNDTNLLLSCPQIDYTGNSFFDIDNPYYRLYIKLNSEYIYNSIDSSSTIFIRFPKKNSEGELSLAQIIRAQPTPTRIGLNSITYTGVDVQKAFNDGGILIEAQDTGKALEAERKSIIFSVLIGTIIAFSLDIMIQLIYKWRRLEPTKSKNSSKK